MNYYSKEIKAFCDSLRSYLMTCAMDEVPSAGFKEEDHPRGGKGSKEGGRFVKSEKTKQKEDTADIIPERSQEEIDRLYRKFPPPTDIREPEASERQLKAVWAARNAVYEALGFETPARPIHYQSLSPTQRGELHNWNSGYRELATYGVAGLERGLKMAEENATRKDADETIKTRPRIYKGILSIAKNVS